MSKKIKITPKFLDCVKKGILECGSRLQYANLIDVAHTTVRDWMEGKTDHVRADVYSRVIQQKSCNNNMFDQEHELKEDGRKNKYIGKVLRTIRKARGLSAEEIATLYGIHEQLIYGYEQGRYFPKTKNLEILCKALRIDPLIIFTYSQTPPSQDFFTIANQIIRDSEESSMPVSQEETIPCDQDPFDNMILEAVRQGLKNLTPEEKTIFFRNTVNFTTNKIKEAFYKK